MKYIPYVKCIFQTSLEKEEVLSGLSKNIAQEKLIRTFWDRKEKPYEGHINGNSFKMKRVLAYENPFLPVFSGTIESNGCRRILKGKMRLNYHILGFMLCLTLGISLFLLLIASGAKSILNEFSSLVLAPIVILIFAYLLTVMVYNIERIKYKIFLIELLQLKSVI
ncbi:MAG TPA: hypothetical protein VJ917_01670 [Saprospiraceae bacterium]|nr:hypothetical protein [Saprospiraceae bacterium]